jgi:F-type H+-transporting ATPase subunit a
MMPMGKKSEVIIQLFGILDVTGEVVTMWIILGIVALLSLVVKRSLKERPGKLQNVVEAGVEYLDNFFTGILGKAKARKYFTFLGSLFIFIIFSNYSGLIPGVGLTDYVKAPTASLSVTAALGIMTFVFLQVSGMRHNIKHYFKHFVSPIAFMLPLLILDEFIKPASLALRLYGNVFGEETVTEELYHILPIGAPMIMMVLSLLFCALQAMVFTMLVSIYLDEITE